MLLSNLTEELNTKLHFKRNLASSFPDPTFKLQNPKSLIKRWVSPS